MVIFFKTIQNRRNLSHPAPLKARRLIWSARTQSRIDHYPTLYQGTLIFVSHDREFVSSLATRILEITPERVIDFSGNYEDYLRSKGIDG